jgi:hypothetical protein
MLDQIDRFDMGQSGSSAEGWFGHRVTDVFQQIIPIYRKIIWSREGLTSGAIGDGTLLTKSDDFFVLLNFLDQSNNLPGVYMSGDGLADDWANTATGANAVAMKGVYMNFNVTTSDFKTLAGMPLNPLLIGTNGGAFDHVLGPDTIVAFGGCPTLRAFDVLSATGLSVVEMSYEGDLTRAAILSQTTPNSNGSTARAMLTGVGYIRLRDFRATGTLARAHHLRDVLLFLQNVPDVPVGAGTPSSDVYSLSQNYPNPFNPTTTIDYSLRDRSQVQLKIYNVAGQLIRTLINDVKTVGAHSEVWNGRNDAGQTVSSGVYFYKLTAKNFTQTKKMVLLK